MWQAALALGVALIGFLGVALGAVVTGYVTLRQARLATQREREIQQMLRTQQRKDAHDAFQRDAIIALQDALRDYWGHVVDAHTQIHGPEGAKTAGDTLEAVFSRMKAAYAPLSAARAKVFDDELRRLVKEFDFKAVQATSLNVKEAREGLAACYERLVEIEDRVNVLLRHLYLF
jgi:type II secretory pathway pseudopilin PulG